MNLDFYNAERGKMSELHKTVNNPKRAINFLLWCRRIHWRYTKHPRWCRGNLGSVEHHSQAVKRYTETIHILENLARGDKYEK